MQRFLESIRQAEIQANMVLNLGAHKVASITGLGSEVYKQPVVCKHALWLIKSLWLFIQISGQDLIRPTGMCAISYMEYMLKCFPFLPPRDWILMSMSLDSDEYEF